MILQSLIEQLSGTFQVLAAGVLLSLAKLLPAIIIFIIGWIIASILERVIDQVFHAVKLDKALRSAGVEDALAKGGIKLNTGAFFGALVKWFVIVVFLIASLQVIGLTQVNDFLREVVLGYLPQVIVAALILLVAAIVADFARKLVLSSAQAAGIDSAAFLGGISRWAIWIFAILVALSQLGIAPAFMQILFTGLVAMLALAGGLAFGLGGKEAAGRFVERLREDISKR